MSINRNLSIFSQNLTSTGAIDANSSVLPTATTSSLGGVKVDGSTITITNGVVSLNTANSNTFTNTQIFTGSATALAAKLSNAKEVITISATAATGTINIDVSTQSILYYTTNSSANFTLNIRSNASNTLNSVMNVGESVTVVFMNTNGGTAYYPSAFQVDGTAVTPKWQGGTAPTSGNASATDVYTYTIIKTDASTYTVLAAQSKFV